MRVHPPIVLSQLHHFSQQLVHNFLFLTVSGTANMMRRSRSSKSGMKIVSVTLVLMMAVRLASALTSMPPLSKQAQHLPLAQKAMDYFDASTDPFHAVQSSVDLLTAAGFEELNDRIPYTGQLAPGGKYFFTRNKSTIVAFCVGAKYAPGNGFKVIGGHTDSPNLKIKPRSKRSSSGCTQLAVECYGGGLWHTWFDRDLGVSGRVFVRNSESGIVEQKLIRIDRAILRVPTLAIHLNSEDERKAFAVNKEDHLSPLLAMEAQKVLTGEKKELTKDGWNEYQEPILLQMISEELDIPIESIADFELNLFDCQRASLGGAYSEFIHSARLDNLASCFLAVRALIDYVEEGKLADDEDVSLVALFDHEEVGSNSAVGAGSPIMGESVERISAALNGGGADADLYQSTIQKSFVLSVDQAHALHPNYSSKHEKGHQPKMNDGMVIKRNSNQRYATNAVTAFLIREIARRAGLPPVQEFVVRNDCGCGSTIGPIISSATGIRAIDMGCPQLSMHSIRETMGVCDLTNGLALFKAFFATFREVDASVQQ
jgi:aspartyl aminopeptidase